MAYNLEYQLKSLNQILHPHLLNHPWIQLDSEHKLLLESLMEKVNFLNQVFENSTGLIGDGVEDLEGHITDAAHDAEDIIESYLVDQILLSLNRNGFLVESPPKRVNFLKQLLRSCKRFSGNRIRSLKHLEGLNQEFDLIKDEIRMIKERIETMSTLTTDLNTNDIHARINTDLVQLKNMLGQPILSIRFDPIEEKITNIMERIETLPGPSSSLPTSSTMELNLNEIVVDIYEGLVQLKDMLDQPNFLNLFDRIEKHITKIKDKIQTVLPSSPSLLPNNIVVGIDEDIKQLTERLVGDKKIREIIPIVGMGGIGKTTLASTVYKHHLIETRFDICAWVTISQESSMKRILLDLLKCILRESTTVELSQLGNEELITKLYQTLHGRRYLIVLDDLWSCQTWDNIRMALPDDSCDSRIMVTTRELAVANGVGGLHHQMNFFNEVESWNLLGQEVFGKETCPAKLEGIGRAIAQHCKGLPLAVHVVGGILTQLPRTQEAWEQVEADVSSAVTSTNEQFANILSLSYNHLPSHLKPCFLYMAVFPEDYEIRVSKLIKLWVAEGFLRPIPDESLENAAKAYLKALVDRNLVFVHRWHETQENVKSCIMHDLMRDLCITKAREVNFFRVNMSRKQSLPPSSRRIIESMIIPVGTALSSPIDIFQKDGFWGLRLLRVLDILHIKFPEFPEEILKLVNLRYLALALHSMCPLPISVLRNLQTIYFRQLGDETRLTSEVMLEIFMIPQLRHLIFKAACPGFYLLPGKEFAVQEDLQTLSTVKVNSSLQKLLESTPNLKKLGLHAEDTLSSCVDLTCLKNLETLKCSYCMPSEDKGGAFLSHIIFPPSLKKLTLYGCVILEEDMNKIAMLFSLEVLKLVCCDFENQTWEPSEEVFKNLKYLQIDTSNLVNWTADETHYPKLKHLIIRDCLHLQEIPADFVQIPTLELIELEGRCSTSVVDSARKIQAEQFDFGNDDFQVRTTSLHV